MLSRKLPPGAAQAVDLASDPGPAQPSNRPVAYSREHLQLLPQTELVNLVLMWQSFHRMLPAPPHAVLQARAGPLGGQQPAQAPDAGTQHVEPQIQVPPFAAAQMKGLAPGAASVLPTAKQPHSASARAATSRASAARREGECSQKKWRWVSLSFIT